MPRAPAAPEPARVDVHPLTPDRWPDLERFFGPNGAYANCWCAFFRLRSKDFEAGCRNGGAANRELLRRLTMDGDVPGLLAYAAGEPVGWVSVAPREQYVRVTNSRLLKPPDPDGVGEQGVWSVVCFWAPPAKRGRGVADTLLAAAVEFAYAHGAEVVEGYPVDTSQSWPGRAALCHGTVGLFERAGFVAVRHPSDHRAVMRHRPGGRPRGRTAVQPRARQPDVR